MEKFKAVEKEMKTKAYSKEGLSAALKLDPKEKEKLEICQFLSNMVDELDRQIETVEAETESLQANYKKGKKDNARIDRIAELERTTERHKWHQSKLELLLRALENGQVDSEQVKDLEDSIKYYVENNQEVDFMEDDSIYDDLNLEEEEDLYGMTNEVDRVSSQDAQSIQDDTGEGDNKVATGTGKQKTPSADPVGPTIRRPSMHLKSPLPVLATLHSTLPSTTNGSMSGNIKPAPLPSRAPGEQLKYASAAAAAAASDKNNVGIAPLPPPPGAASTTALPGLAPLPPVSGLRSTSTGSPSAAHPQPPNMSQIPSHRQVVAVAGAGEGSSSTHSITKSPAHSHSSLTAPSTSASSIPPTPATEKSERVTQSSRKSGPQDELGQSTKSKLQTDSEHGREKNPKERHINGDAGVATEQDQQSTYALPSSLLDLIDSFEATKTSVSSGTKPGFDRLFGVSHATCPESVDAEQPRHYRPKNPYPYTPSHYPQEPLPVFDDPRLYSRLEIDTLFYTFYFRQGTYEQYLAAKALKSQSWRFHKQYQTWFQRHEEPKSITEEYEQGTYRFFDYESTW